jgi:hypothetical protein
VVLEYSLKQPAYVEENIQLSMEWIKQYNGDAVNFKLKYDEDDNFQELKTSVSNLSLKEILDEDEQAIENNNEDQNPGGVETLMYDTIDHLILEKYKFAPGEDEIPIPILMDKYAEELSFPKIYCGKKRKFKEKLRISSGAIAKSEIRQYDRRCAENISKILYSFKKSQIEQVSKAITFAIKKNKNNNNITVENVLDRSYLHNIMQRDERYNILKSIRCSPSYWEGRKKEILAMIRQLGCPTIFITLSAAETKLPELLVILTRNVHNLIITESEANQLKFEAKAELIRKDPVTCARYFDHRINQLIYKIFKKPAGPFKGHDVEDFYYRVEFQHRGSPHIHMVM